MKRKNGHFFRPQKIGLVSSKSARNYVGANKRASETTLILSEGIGERCIAYLERKARLEREVLSRSVNCLAIGASLEREQQALRQEVLALLAHDWKALYFAQRVRGKGALPDLKKPLTKIDMTM